MRRSRNLGVAAALLLMAVACNNQPQIFVSPAPLNSPSPSATPSLYSPGPTHGPRSPKPSNAFGSPSTPSSSPSPTPAQKEVFTQFAVLDKKPVYHPPAGSMSLSWRAERGQLLAISADHIFTGTKPTSKTLTLSMSVQVNQQLTHYSSDDGSCKVTMASATTTSVRGSFECPSLPSPGGKIRVTGEFSAHSL